MFTSEVLRWCLRDGVMEQALCWWFGGGGVIDWALHWCFRGEWVFGWALCRLCEGFRWLFAFFAVSPTISICCTLGIVHAFRAEAMHPPLSWPAHSFLHIWLATPVALLTFAQAPCFNLPLTKPSSRFEGRVAWNIAAKVKGDFSVVFFAGASSLIGSGLVARLGFAIGASGLTSRGRTCMK